jgi:hypothetical protein
MVPLSAGAALVTVYFLILLRDLVKVVVERSSRRSCAGHAPCGGRRRLAGLSAAARVAELGVPGLVLEQGTEEH